jgi:hypothetical protein
VLTARHCNVLPTDQVRVGSTTRNAGGQLIGVAEVRNHPLSSPGTDDEMPRYDVTMVRLDTPESHAAAQPLTRVTTGAAGNGLWEAGDLLTVTGWGTTETGSTSNTLRQAQVPRISDAECAADYGAYFDSTDMVCAGYAAGGIDTCQGDSGGPLIAPVESFPSKSDPSDWRLVGVTSWGFGCAEPDQPGVYARLGNTVLGDWTSVEPLVPDTPRLAGGSRVGETVTCDNGNWGTSGYFTYRFFRDGDTPIATTTSGSYLLTASDVGHRVSCRVRGQNVVSDHTSGESNRTDAVAPRPVPASTAAPVLAGEPVVGRELRCDPGAWSEATTVTPSFRRIAADGSSRGLASGSRSYVTVPEDAGARIVCVEVATNGAGSAEAASNAIGPVTAPPPVAAPQPQVVPPPPPDLVRPRAVLDRPARCRLRRCTVVVRVDDAAPSAGILGVQARLRRGTGSRARQVALRAVRLGPALFRVRTGPLTRGAATLRLSAIDNAGNAQSVATVVRLRVR